MGRLKRYTSILLPMILVSGVPAFAATIPKSGAGCKIVNKVQKVKNQNLICLRKGGKLLWSIQKKSQDRKVSTPETESTSINPEAIPMPSPVSDKPKVNKQEFRGPCDDEIDVDPYWVPLRDFYRNMNWCLGPVKTVPVELTQEEPKILETSKKELLSQGTCQIKEQDSIANGRAFPSDRNRSNRNASLHPGPKTVFQLIPIYSVDAPSYGRTPQEDYKGYIDFLQSYITYASDGETKVEFRVPNEYILFPEKLGDYDMRHENNWDNPTHLALGKKILDAVDSKINFAGVNFSIVVAPAGTGHDVLEQAVLNRFGQYQTLLDGQPINFLSIGTPATFNSAPIRNQNFTSPMWWFHELHHVAVGLADHNGDNFYQNGRSPNTDSPGMGNWGLMSMSKTELTSWEKWMMGYIMDSQVRCTSTSTTTTHWITPSSFKSQKTKLLVIYLSESKVIVVESIRAGGLNYKLGKDSEGALVYLVDTFEPGHEFGLKVLRAPTEPINVQPFILSNATLKVGEKIIYDDIEIKVVESGDFGDVVTVSKSN